MTCGRIERKGKITLLKEKSSPPDAKSQRANEKNEIKHSFKKKEKEKLQVRTWRKPQGKSYKSGIFL